MIRGESKSIAFGLLEDDPWQEGSGERTRWEYKDWGTTTTSLRIGCSHRRSFRQ